jgi:hypothetical protein
MLSIGKLGAGQEGYYLDKVAEGAEDYYSGEGEAEGQWVGSAAEDLGLDGAVEADQLTAMLTGKNPATGEPLGLRGRRPWRGSPPSISPSRSRHGSHSRLRRRAEGPAAASRDRDGRQQIRERGIGRGLGLGR